MSWSAWAGWITHTYSCLHAAMCDPRRERVVRACIIIRACYRRRDWKTEYSDGKVIHLEMVCHMLLIC
jgi:hypothetical protein